MAKYTYTASLVDEAINILRRADQELSGTGAAVINAVNTILNARGADRLAFDFDDILDITDYARDDIAAITKEIINKQTEIEEYENAPWWKKLFSSIGMALLKFIEGHAQAIEYVFDLAVSLAGFIGGIFNSNFKASCQEFVEKEHVDNWFTQQFINEDGWFHDINSYSVFAYNSTAANIIEFGGSLVQSLGALGTNPIGGAAALYKSFENLIDDADTQAIVTATPIIYPKIKEIFEIEPVDDPEIPRDDGDGGSDDEPVIDDGDPVNPPTEGDDQFDDDPEDETPPKKEEKKKEEEVVIIGGGEDGGIQVLYGPPPIRPEEPVIEIVEPGIVDPPIQVLYGPPPIQPEEPIIGIIDPVNPPIQVLYGPHPGNPTDPTTPVVPNEEIVAVGHGDPTVNIPKGSSTDVITKKTVGSFGDLLDGVGSTPVSSKPISSKDTNVEGKAVTPLASGVIAAGAAGWGTKTYMDKRKSSSDEEDKDELEAEEWNEDPENLSIDYNDGVAKDPNADYLSPEDELAFME